MLRPSITLLTLFLSLTALAETQQAQEGRRGPGQGDRRGAGEQEERKLLEQFDVDENGWLDQEERGQARLYMKENPVRGGLGGPGRQAGGPEGGRGPGAGGERRRGPGGPGGPGGGGRRGAGGGGTEPGTPGIQVAPEDVQPLEAGLFDPSVLRTVFVTFENEDWEDELQEFHGTDVELTATLTVDGKPYPNCGIRFRGKSSYSRVSKGSKRSFNVSLDFVDGKQRLLGYKTLNLLNCNGDDSMLSTVLYSQLANRHMPAPKANMVRVVVNGESWGVYTNVQQFNKTFLREHYPSAKGTRWKVSGSPRGGGGLDYRGEDSKSYGFPYEMKGNDPKALAKLIELCRVLEETPVADLEAALEDKLDVQELLWFLALDNALCNSDGYWVRASDYSIFLDKDGRFHILPHDMNEAFRQVSARGPGGPGRGQRGQDREPQPAVQDLDPLIGMDDDSKPLRSKILAVPALRAKYLENIRSLAQELEWKQFGPLVSAWRMQLEAEVKADTRKLGSFESFMASTSQDADTEQESGRGAMNLHRFAQQRSAYLLKQPATKQPQADK
jgi:spore coat protein CotH